MGVSASNLAAAAGDTFRTRISDQLVIASFSAASQLELRLIGGFGDGSANDLLIASGTFFGWWTTGTQPGRTAQNDTLSPRNLSIDIGDLDGDGYDDEIVVAYVSPDGSFARLGIFENDAALASGGKVNLVDPAQIDVGIPNPVGHITVKVGDIDQALDNGRIRDEIVLLTDQHSGGGLPASSLAIRGFKANITGDPSTGNGPGCLPSASVYNGICVTQSGQWTGARQASSHDFELADTDRDGRKEIVLGLGSANTHIETFDAENLFSAGVPLVLRNQFDDSAYLVDAARRISVAAGDVDATGQATIFAAYSKSGTNQVDAIRLKDSLAPGGGLTYFEPQDDGNGSPQKLFNLSNSRRPLIALGDTDSDTVFATLEGLAPGEPACNRTIESKVTEVVHVPPHWTNLNSANLQGTIGENLSQTSGTASSISRMNSHALSVFAKSSAGFSVGIVDLGVSIGVEPEQSYAATGTAALLDEQGQSLTFRNFAADDFLLVENSTYDCFNYRIRCGASSLPATPRLCELKLGSLEAVSKPVTLDLWDTDEIDLVWNYSELAYADWGVRDLAIAASNDGVAFTPIATFTLAMVSSAPALPQRLDLPDGTVARFVRFQILNNHGATGSGLSEVQFLRASGTPVVVAGGSFASSVAAFSRAQSGAHVASADVESNGIGIRIVPEPSMGIALFAGALVLAQTGRRRSAIEGRRKGR